MLTCIKGKKKLFNHECPCVLVTCNEPNFSCVINFDFFFFLHSVVTEAVLASFDGTVMLIISL